MQNSALAKPFGLSFKNLISKYHIVLSMVLLHTLLRILIVLPVIHFLYTGSKNMILPIASIILYVLVALPLRSSFAESMEKLSRNEPVTIMQSFSFCNYQDKFVFQIKQLLKLVLWAIPFIAIVGACVYLQYVNRDFIAMRNQLAKIGAWLYGANASMVEGIKTILIAILCSWLFILFGTIKNVGLRYLYHSPIRFAVMPYAELRRCLHGQKVIQFCIGFIELVLLLPAVSVLYFSVLTIYNQTNNLLSFLPTITSLRTLLPTFLTAFGLYVLFLPLRKILSASFAAHCRYHRENEKN